MLGECRDAMAAHETGDHSYFAYVTVDGVDDLYRELSPARPAGATVPTT